MSQSVDPQVQTMIDNMPAAVFLRDADGRFILVNRAYEEMYGVTDAEIRGRTLDQVFPSDAARDYAAHDARVVERRSVVELESTARSSTRSDRADVSAPAHQHGATSPAQREGREGTPTSRLSIQLR